MLVITLDREKRWRRQSEAVRLVVIRYIHVARRIYPSDAHRKGKHLSLSMTPLLLAASSLLITWVRCSQQAKNHTVNSCSERTDRLAFVCGCDRTDIDLDAERPSSLAVEASRSILMVLCAVSAVQYWELRNASHHHLGGKQEITLMSVCAVGSNNIELFRYVLRNVALPVYVLCERQ